MLILISLLACSSAPAEGQAATERHAPDATAARVEVATLEPTVDVAMNLSLPGEVEGSEDAVLSSALGGQVEKVLIGKGENVRAGQAIARIDSDIYGAQLAQAEAQRDQAAAELQRVQAMGDLASDSQRLQAETQAKIRAAQVRAAQAQMSRAVVKAPFSGIAADVFPTRGEFMGPGSPVARVVQLDPAKVTLSVADRDVVMLESGLEVIVKTAATPEPVVGRIAHVGRAADLRTRSFPVDIEVPNPDGLLLPGMIATVSVERPLTPGTLVIPQDWVVTRRTGQGVFTVGDDGFAKWVPILLGDVLHDQVVVQDGLAPGARVVIAGHRDLVDGDKVLVSREGFCCANGRTTFGDR